MIYRLREWFKILLNHRAIIEKLQDEKRYIENNAVNIINLVDKEGLSLTITAPLQSFGWLVRLGVVGTPIQGACISQMKIPPLYKIEEIIKQIRDYQKKAGKK